MLVEGSCKFCLITVLLEKNIATSKRLISGITATEKNS